MAPRPKLAWDLADNPHGDIDDGDVATFAAPGAGGPPDSAGGHHIAPPGYVHFGYETLAASVGVTGVRADSATTDAVVVTASEVSGGVSTAALYQGSLQDIATATASAWNALTPVFTGQTVTASIFYGPNTSLFDPSLGAGDVRAVGSYKYYWTADGPSSETKYDHGMMYVGPVTGNGNSGTWTPLDATSLVHSGDTLLNTIPHSTMGSLVVGNYDTQLATGHAFVYDITSGDWREMNPAHSLSITAYGIWQNGGSGSTSYTVAGGYSDLNHLGVDAGYLVDYDSATHEFTNFTTFQFGNLPHAAMVSHFDGISATNDGYTLTGEYLLGKNPGAFFAEVTRQEDGSFDTARWADVAYPGADLTTGNTVIGDTVFGIYATSSKSGVESHSYVAPLEVGTNHSANPSQDTIVFNHALFVNSMAAFGAAKQVGADTVIRADANDSVTLTHTLASALSPNNFHIS